MSCNCNNYRSMSGLGVIKQYDPNSPLFAAGITANTQAQDYTKTGAYQALNADKYLIRPQQLKQDKPASDNTAMYLGVGAAAALALLLLI